MRFISYKSQNTEGLAFRDGESYRGLPVSVLDGDLSAYADRLDDLAAELEGAPELGDFTLLPPISRPGKILCIGLNYRSHSDEAGFEVPTYPTVFARFANGLVAHGQPLIRPNASTMFDYECELAVVIGKAGRHIAEKDALSHVAGYAPFNDGSVRDFQLKTPQWTMGKAFDATGGFGPELVTPDELPPGCSGLRIRTILNGETLQDANTADLIFPVSTLVATLSEAMSLEPGDIIVTGTPEGVGGLRNPQVWLKPGDECVVEIEQLGRLVNPVEQEA
ncbi:MAG: fumarylacetoacetate hydrolase family protein [Propionibacteriaceae bacterium]|jgi:2-keto-4-pentenoate hydratase/2-oxohepta-3-ene-1,7-dioic acid hydratase in catechol pathway|nr:fumarylacetoacetate hydrolase family protein [Propionibacteriaceae bacterium]